MSLQSCIYSGWVMHRRLHPVRHKFRYRAWWLLLDLDELDVVDRRLRLFSRARANVIAFHDRDHGRTSAGLRTEIASTLAENAIADDGGPVRLLCTPRIFGYQFNPLSIYFCYRKSGDLTAVVYEVHNTFGERHSYCLAATVDADGNVRQRTDKAFFVSPFIGMGLHYDFRFTPPAEGLTVGITASEPEKPVLHAMLQGERQTLSDWRLFVLLVTRPLVTWKVITAIHYEAFRLWRKGLAIFSHAAASSETRNDHKTTERQRA